MMGLNWGSLQACLDGLLLCNLRPIFLSSYDYPVQRWNGFITERERRKWYIIDFKNKKVMDQPV
jgi:hypothetical protein